MRYRVDPAAMVCEGADVAAAARTLGRSRVSEQLGSLREAVPGGATAEAVSGIASSWRTELTGLRSRVRSLGEALDAAAAAYEQVEASATLALSATR